MVVFLSPSDIDVATGAELGKSVPQYAYADTFRGLDTESTPDLNSDEATIAFDGGHDSDVTCAIEQCNAASSRSLPAIDLITGHHDFHFSLPRVRGSEEIVLPGRDEIVAQAGCEAGMRFVAPGIRRGLVASEFSLFRSISVETDFVQEA
ncbi:hypothetical protein [Acuticoccus kandeliae]|uniref:hypothetical protein n=1 Tax=Acuticoccus kandeliae TaxID=2073160 RepID=UPI000D3EA275|nr:hypothetical protein [Acuticoccus kandeliae]